MVNCVHVKSLHTRSLCHWLKVMSFKKKKFFSFLFLKIGHRMLELFLSQVMQAGSPRPWVTFKR